MNEVHGKSGKMFIRTAYIELIKFCLNLNGTANNRAEHEGNVVKNYILIFLLNLYQELDNEDTLITQESMYISFQELKIIEHNYGAAHDIFSCAGSQNASYLMREIQFSTLAD